MQHTFEDLGLIPELLATLNDLGYEQPTPIQAQAIPPLLAGQDVMAQSQTGTGKTAAFTLPLVQQINADALQLLVLAPTRELATQVAQSVHRYGSNLGLRVLPIYGQQSYSRQIRRLKKGVHVVVGTPGRTLDLIQKRELDLSDIRFLVLDEADEMLKMGFIDDIEAILSATPADTRQTVLFSATLPAQIQRLAQQYMRDPLHIEVEAQEVTVSNINQRYYMVQERDKTAALCRLLEVEDLQNTLVFTRTRAGAADLAETLTERGYPTMAIHGDLAQNERERILHRFRSGQVRILVGTDVVARGVDIPDVSHVINYDIPQMPAEYVHRIGRTGRAGRDGDAMTLVTPGQRRRLKQIEDYTHKSISKGELPSREQIIVNRDEQFKAELLQEIDNATETDGALLEDLVALGYTAEQIAAVALHLLRGSQPTPPLEEIRDVKEKSGKNSHREPRKSGKGKSGRRKRERSSHEAGMTRLRLDIGRKSGVRPGDIVYGVASAANIPGRSIGAIDIRQDETFLDVPDDQVGQVLAVKKPLHIRGQSVKLALPEST